METLEFFNPIVIKNKNKIIDITAETIINDDDEKEYVSFSFLIDCGFKEANGKYSDNLIIDLKGDYPKKDDNGFDVFSFNQIPENMNQKDAIDVVLDNEKYFVSAINKLKAKFINED